MAFWKASSVAAIVGPFLAVGVADAAALQGRRAPPGPDPGDVDARPIITQGADGAVLTWSTARRAPGAADGDAGATVAQEHRPAVAAAGSAGAAPASQARAAAAGEAAAAAAEQAERRTGPPTSQASSRSHGAAQAANGVQLASVGNGTDPWAVSAGRDECSGCDFTVNLRCEGGRFGRQAAAHRISNCLLTMYGMVQLARMAANSRPDVHVCALTWQDGHGMDLRPFLRDVVGVTWHALVDENDRCASGLQYHAGYRTSVMGAQPSWLADFGKDEKMIRAYSIDIEANFRWMQRDSSAFVGHVSPQVVIIQRRGTTRSFREADLEMLKDRMAVMKLGQRQLPLAVYYGDEGVADTVRMFAQAAEVVGYHGGGMVNTLFSAQRHCIHHISTFKDIQGQRQWRVNGETRMNRQGSFNVYAIPLIDVLDGNDVTVDRFEEIEDKDHFIKDLRWVPLAEYHLVHLQDAVSDCLRVWVEGQW